MSSEASPSPSSSSSSSDSSNSNSKSSSTRNEREKDDDDDDATKKEKKKDGLEGVRKSTTSAKAPRFIERVSETTREVTVGSTRERGVF